MASPLDPGVPANSDSPFFGAAEIRAVKQFLIDLFGIPPAPAQITTPIGSVDTNGVFTFTTAPKGGRSMPGVRLFSAVNSAASPTTKFDLIAQYVTFRQITTNEAYSVAPPTPLTVDINLGGPAILGRDQAAAFPASSWIYFYYIYNPTTGQTSAIASQAALGNPVLPAGFTMSSLATIVYLDAGGALKSVRCRGSWVWYDAHELIAAAAASTVDGAIGYSTTVAPFASHIQFEAQLLANAVATNGFDSVEFRFIAGGGVFLAGPSVFASTALGAMDHTVFIAPNIGTGTIIYRIVRGSVGGGPVILNMWVNGYQVSNGD